MVGCSAFAGHLGQLLLAAQWSGWCGSHPPPTRPAVWVGFGRGRDDALDEESAEAEMWIVGWEAVLWWQSLVDGPPRKDCERGVGKRLESVEIPATCGTLSFDICHKGHMCSDPTGWTETPALGGPQPSKDLTYVETPPPSITFHALPAYIQPSRTCTSSHISTLDELVCASNTTQSQVFVCEQLCCMRALVYCCVLMRADALMQVGTDALMGAYALMPQCALMGTNAR
eukprot:1159234-Pelagomonas_calceolata.AAC.2